MKEKLKEILKTIVKFLTIITGLFVILIVGLLIVGSLIDYTVYKLEFSHKMSYEEYQAKSDCDEFGICKEGLEFIVEKDIEIINKENCLKYNFEWREDLNACNMR